MGGTGPKGGSRGRRGIDVLRGLGRGQVECAAVADELSNTGNDEEAGMNWDVRRRYNVLRRMQADLGKVGINEGKRNEAMLLFYFILSLQSCWDP